MKLKSCLVLKCELRETKHRPVIYIMDYAMTNKDKTLEVEFDSTYSSCDIMISLGQLKRFNYKIEKAVKNLAFAGVILDEVNKHILAVKIKVHENAKKSRLTDRVLKRIVKNR